MRILRATDHRVMPWKNGGGTTTEIAVYPEGAGLDTFEWRVSMARVETDGPFSAFPGVERTLAILDGEGIRLDTEGQKPVELTARSKPLGFAADVKTSAALLGGPVTDLNVMTRRGTWKHSVEHVELRTPLALEPRRDVTLVLVTNGKVRIDHDGRTSSLARFDCLVRDNEDVLRIQPGGDATLFVVRLKRG